MILVAVKKINHVKSISPSVMVMHSRVHITGLFKVPKTAHLPEKNSKGLLDQTTAKHLFLSQSDVDYVDSFSVISEPVNGMHGIEKSPRRRYSCDR